MPILTERGGQRSCPGGSEKFEPCPPTPIHVRCLRLRSRVTGRRYVGSCGDLDRRLYEHNAGQCASTRNGVPWRLLHGESFSTRLEAAERALLHNRPRQRGTRPGCARPWIGATNAQHRQVAPRAEGPAGAGLSCLPRPRRHG